MLVFYLRTRTQGQGLLLYIVWHWQVLIGIFLARNNSIGTETLTEVIMEFVRSWNIFTSSERYSFSSQKPCICHYCINSLSSVSMCPAYITVLYHYFVPLHLRRYVDRIYQATSFHFCQYKYVLSDDANSICTSITFRQKFLEWVVYCCSTNTGYRLSKE